MKGVEPLTSWLQIKPSTIEIHQQSPVSIRGNKTPCVGIEPTTRRLTVCRSTNWANREYMMGRVGVEPTKPEATHLQCASFNHLHTYPISGNRTIKKSNLYIVRWEYSHLHLRRMTAQSRMAFQGCWHSDCRTSRAKKRERRNESRRRIYVIFPSNNTIKLLLYRCGEKPCK